MMAECRQMAPKSIKIKRLKAAELSSKRNVKESLFKIIIRGALWVFMCSKMRICALCVRHA